jgi:hypothetical protein
MFHVKHFGTIELRANIVFENAGRCEAGIWRKRKHAVEFMMGLD